MAALAFADIIRLFDEHLAVIHQAALAPSTDSVDVVRQAVGPYGTALVEVWQLLWPEIESDERRRQVVFDRLSRREPWSEGAFQRVIGDVLFSDPELVRQVTRLVVEPADGAGLPSSSDAAAFHGRTEDYPPVEVSWLGRVASRAPSPEEVSTLLQATDSFAPHTDAAIEEHWEPGVLVGGRFVIVRKVGSGGFGETWLAKDQAHASQRQCIIKKFTFRHDNERILANSRARFEKEAQVLERLGQGHEQIPSVYSFEAIGVTGVFVQEYIEGSCLVECVESRGSLGEEEVLAFLDSVLGVLAYVHENKIIHRDVKPQNILLRDCDGEPVLIDFGAVKEIATAVLDGVGQASTTMVIGTPGFMPIEQGLGRPRFATDVFALGFTALYLLTSKWPSELTSRETDEVEWSEIGEAASPELRVILSRAIARLPDDRFPTAAAMRTAVRSLLRMRHAKVRPVPEGWPELDEVVEGNSNDPLRGRTFAEVLARGGVEVLLTNFGAKARALAISPAEATLTFDNRNAGGRLLIFASDDDEGEVPNLADISLRIATQVSKAGHNSAFVLYLFPEGSRLLARASVALSEDLSVHGVALTVVACSYDRTGNVRQANANYYGSESSEHVRARHLLRELSRNVRAASRARDFPSLTLHRYAVDVFREFEADGLDETLLPDSGAIVASAYSEMIRFNDLVERFGKQSETERMLGILNMQILDVGRNARSAAEAALDALEVEIAKWLPDGDKSK